MVKKKATTKTRHRSGPEEILERLREQIARVEARAAQRADPNYHATRKLKRLANKLREEGADLKVLDAIEKL